MEKNKTLAPIIKLKVLLGNLRCLIERAYDLGLEVEGFGGLYGWVGRWVSGWIV